MKLKGREKFFWERNFNVKSVESIPASIKGIKGIDSDHDDEFFFFLSSRVRVVEEIHLRCTNLTDVGVKHISTFSKLRDLTLKDHCRLTKSCLYDLNKLTDLEYLDISKNNFSLEDVLLLTDLKKLKTLILSSDKPETEIAESLVKLEAQFRGVEITVY